MSYALVAVLAAGVISLMPAFAELPPACPDCVGDRTEQVMKAAQDDIPITISTDSAVYDHKSMIMIEGQVAYMKASTPVTLTVTSPTNNVVTIQQIEVGMDGGYSTELSTAGDLWKYDGVYTIRVQYGSQEASNRALVELTGGITTRPAAPATCEDNELVAGSSCVPYSISGGMVTGTSTGDAGELNTLVIDIMADEDGTLTIDPIIPGCIDDDGLLIIVDGEEWDDYTFDGTTADVMFPAGAESIEFIGACVVPEFGTIAVLILAVAIVSIIAVTARSRLGLTPRF